MASITLYVLNDEGAISHTRSGDIGTLMSTVDKLSEKYTTQPPPDPRGRWLWLDNKWTNEGVQQNG